MKSLDRKDQATREKGYTLVEMIVVLAILSIMLAGSIQFYIHTESYQMGQVAKEIKYFIEDTKQVAVLTNKIYQVIYTVEKQEQFFAQQSEAKRKKKLIVPKDIEVGISTEKHVPVEGQPLPNIKDFAFHADMSPGGNSGTVWMRHRRTQEVIKITVEPTVGYVRIYRS